MGSWNGRRIFTVLQLARMMGRGFTRPLVESFGKFVLQYDHVFYLATNKHLKYETQGEVVSLA